MSLGGYASYFIVGKILPGRIATLIGLMLSVIIYVAAIIGLNILSKEEIKDMPKGNAIYNFLVRIGVYKEEVTE